MKWNEKQKEQLRELAFEERSNAEIADIMGIALTDVYSARSRFGWTIPKVREAKMDEGGEINEMGAR